MPEDNSISVILFLLGDELGGPPGSESVYYAFPS